MVSGKEYFVKNKTEGIWRRTKVVGEGNFKYCTMEGLSDKFVVDYNFKQNHEWYEIKSK